MNRIFILIAIFSAMFISAGCGSKSTPGTVFNGGGTGQLYISQAVSKSILRFDKASTATGGVTVAATISGAATLMQAPQHILLDVTNNRLFVSDSTASSIFIFENANSKTGNVAPDRTVSGVSTNLTAPTAIALDRTRDLLYVANGNNVLVFTPASTTNGNTIPIRTFNLGFSADEIFFDQTNDRLFATDSTHDAVDVYDNASLLPNGVTAASRTVTGAATGLSHPSGLGIDATGRLVVSNLNAPGITIYANAATVNGNAVPAATLTGSNTGFSHPSQIVLNNNPGTGDSGDLYIADGSAASVIVFTNIGTATGNVAPARKITGLTSAKGVALDTTR